jgi:histidine triad (HIT) family protein
MSIAEGNRLTGCIFCRIISGAAPGTILYRDELVTAFRDIHPVAPTHVLVVPNRHIPSVDDVQAEDEAVLGRLFTVAREIARAEGIAEDGYRLIVNNGSDGGQVVYHLHLHLIGGRRMRYPMG